MIEKLRVTIRAWLGQYDFSAAFAALLESVIGLALVSLFAIIVQRLIRAAFRVFVPSLVKRLGSGKPKRWIEALQNRFVAGRSAHIVAAFLLYWLVPDVLEPYPRLIALLRNALEGYVVIVVTIAINAIIAATGDVFSGESDKDELPLRIATQAAKGIITVAAAVVFISVVFDTSVTVLASSLAGMTAVIMLLFRDSILGFVAGIQLSGNDMLRIGDWIEVPQYGANGTVQDVRLTTVKVQNFDKTITTIPTYALVSESFKNWRGMKDSGARRIKRSVIVDMESIHFLTEEEIQELRQVYLLQSYLTEQLAEIQAYNDTFAPEARHPPNARGLTNLGTFRVYLESYLNHQPALKEGMLILVRHLEPSPQGLPIEIYGFSKEQDWEEYERIQSNVFEHILAVLPKFGLRVYQLAKSSS